MALALSLVPVGVCLSYPRHPRSLTRQRKGREKEKEGEKEGT